MPTLVRYGLLYKLNPPGLIRVEPDWQYIIRKPNFKSASLVDVASLATAEQGAKADAAVQDGDPRLTDARPPKAHTHAFTDLTGKPAVITVEKDLGALPRTSGTFDITGLSGLTPGTPVLIQQASGPYTGKGALADEAEMDALIVNAFVLDATTIRAYWHALSGFVIGNFKFNYLPQLT
jgi:hypothetical protein